MLRPGAEPEDIEDDSSLGIINYESSDKSMGSKESDARFKLLINNKISLYSREISREVLFAHMHETSYSAELVRHAAEIIKEDIEWGVKDADGTSRAEYLIFHTS